MFRKLRLQFILTNIGIITALFLSLTIGAYILLQIQMMNHAEFFSKRLAEGILSDAFKDFPPPREDGPPSLPLGPETPGMPPFENRPPQGFPKPPIREKHKPFQMVFFVKTNPKGEIIYRSSYRPFSKEKLVRLTKQAFANEKASGIVEMPRASYFYYKTLLREEPGALIVFQDLKQEKNIQYSLVISLAITGVVYLFLSLLGSLFMAERAIKPIQKAWQQQKDFLADASHELRTPLTVIQANLEVVLSNPRETVVSQMVWLNNVKDELQQMIGLVSSLLFLARVDSEQTIMEIGKFDLSEAVNRVFLAFKPIAEAKGIQIGIDTSGEIAYYGDESNLRQAMEILLDNAVRHTPTGGSITIDLRRSDRKVVLSIADTGEGIAEEHLEKIFDRFYQVQSSRSNGGSGLGLAIAKCIVEKHAGTIRVSSKPGQGTIFTIHLPANND